MYLVDLLPEPMMHYTLRLDRTHCMGNRIAASIFPPSNRQSDYTISSCCCYLETSPPPSNHTTTFRILGTRDAKNKSAFAFWFLSTPQTILSHGTVRSNANKWVAHSRTHTARSSGATFFTSSPYAKCYRYSLSYMYMSELDKLGR